MKDSKRLFDAISKIKDMITRIAKIQNTNIKCIIDCQKRIEKLEKKNG
tara:strand:- start:67 stop:210 length:144 start_codon:yes stop_codon:yes gene_type:complete